MTGLVRNTRAELIRLLRWPTLWIMVGSWFALNQAFIYIFPYIAYTTGSSSRVADEPAEQLIAEMLPSAVPTSMLQGTPLFGGAIFMTLGALVVGAGYSWGTWKTVLTTAVSRRTVLWGTLTALGMIIVGVLTLTCALDFVVATVIASVEGESTALPAFGDLIQRFGAALLIMGMWTSFGALVGAITRSPSLAIGLGLVWSLVVENMLRAMTRMLDDISVLTDHLPGTAAGSLAGALGAVSGDDGTPGVLTTLSGSTSTAILIGLTVGCAAGATLLKSQRDLA